MIQLSKITICLIAIWLTLLFHIDDNNELTELRRLIPEIEKEVKALKELNVQLQYQVDQFISPENLLELAKQPEYSHLKPSFLNEIVILQEPQISNQP